jgi:hypothetical protein
LIPPFLFLFPFGPFALRLCFSWKYKLNPLLFLLSPI